jgi:NADH:ubiquinone reductase (H+-translocating)
MPRVVIVGAGFGGLHCAKRLAGKPVEVLLLDRRNYHLFTPLLYQVASSLLNASDIAFPVRAVFRRTRNVAFRMADVAGVEPARRVVRTAEGPDEPYDYLVLATGARANYFGQQAVERASQGLNDLSAALRLRDHVLSRFEAAATASAPDRRRLLTFVVVGGGPTGVEYAGALAELVKLIVGWDYPTIHRSEVRIVLVEGADRLLGTFPPSLSADARRRLERLGATVRLGALVQSVSDHEVHLSSGEVIEADTLVWAAGVRAESLEGGLTARRARNGRLEVDEYLRVPDMDGVFAIGDAAAFMQDGRQIAMLSRPAIEQGYAVAGNILRAIRGATMRPFRYRDPGIMAIVGRNAAVAVVRGVSLKGWLGWWAWLAVHLYFLIGFRNRLAALLGWAWNYVFYDRPIRFVVGEGPATVGPRATGFPP